MGSFNLSFMLYILFIIVWSILAFKLGDWRKWRLYYPTILFFWCGNLISAVVFEDHLLWEFKSKLLSHKEADFIQMLFVFTSSTILFLQYYPEKFSSQVFYILLWVLIYSSVEWVFHLFGVIVYNYGWNILWSIVHNIYQFIFLRIHYKKPILAWVLAIFVLGITMKIFDVSL